MTAIPKHSPAWIWMDGAYVPEEQATLSVLDRGFLFGDGIFTTARVSEGKLQFFSEHCARLEAQCRAIGIFPPAISIEWIQELIERNQATSGNWRLKIIVTGGKAGDLNLHERKWGSFILMLKPYALSYSPKRLTLFPDLIQLPYSSLKTLSYLHRLWVQDYAQKRGYEDAIVQSYEGYLLETSFSNLFWYDQKTLFVPDISLSYLKGIILEKILSKSEAGQFKVEFVRSGIEEIPATAAVYTCNSLTPYCPVIEIERRLFKQNSAFEKTLEKLLDSSP